ncbi:CDP-alcohol phosphatidyltransferase family protein [Cohaesibacter marisflavi]|uniref:CDP-alcohol phosphatidyltransferase family protein n=1 Tax=Cohaesibacter marisflavi TaxID=655353 RepID=UPI0029C71814|nr:CDP-alcohol phosphatidyltransferase family protein [Cohaesibacter marisflavi]
MKAAIIEAPGAGNHSLDPALFRRLKINALAILAVLFGFALGAYYIAAPHLALTEEAIIPAAFLLLVIFSLVLRGLPNHPHQRFGVANVVTSFRAVIVCLVAATVFCARDLSDASSPLWLLVGLVGFALLLDGVDGYLARTLNLVSELGARFDMEVDALLLLVLSIAVYMLDKAGVWVIAIGMMRYCFVFAQIFFPSLKQNLSASFRRKLVCVIQGGVLCFCLMPVVSPHLSGSLAFMALALLSYSFGVDTLHLLRKDEMERVR